MYLKRFVRLGLLSIAIITLTACATGGQRPSSNIPKITDSEEFSSRPMKPFIPVDYTLDSGDELTITFMDLPGVTNRRYTLQPGDILLAEFHGNEYLNRDLIVGPDGYIAAPFIGEVVAAGKQVSVLKDEIIKKYSEGGFLNDTHMTFSLVRSNSSYKEIQKLNTDGRVGFGRSVRVEMDGQIRLPLTGSVMAAGKTVDEVEKSIQAIYSSFFSSASILVEVKEIRSNLVYVLGYVNRPGMLNMTSPTTLTQAISQAGGFQETAGLDSVVVVRRGPEGQPDYSLFDLNAVLTKGDMSGDVLLRRYDVVYVPPSTIHEMNKAVLYGIKNMMPVHSTSVNAGFTYLFGPASGSN